MDTKIRLIYMLPTRNYFRSKDTDTLKVRDEKRYYSK